MPKDPTRTRKALLAAASQVIQKDGALALTFEAVAKIAGVSKGGLLYHFPSKEALIKGLIEATLDAFEQRIAKLMGEDEQIRGRWTRAYWIATLEDGQTEALASMFAAAMLDPVYQPAMLAQTAEWQARSADDGLDPALAELLKLAADGYWFAQLHGIAPDDETARGKLKALVMDLTQGK